MNMLSTQHSSIDDQQQLRQPQQQLETQLLAQQIPKVPYHRAHTRGLSLDQRVIRPTSTIPLSPPQSHGTPSPYRQYQAGLQVSIPESDTGYQFLQDTQHITQAAQQHRSGQPGQDNLTFQAHLQQQLQGQSSSSTTVQEAEQAKRKLLEHITWFQATYSEPAQSITATASATPLPASLPFAFRSHLPLSPPQHSLDLPQHGQQVQSTIGNSHTVPNTPQRREMYGRQFLTGSKHARSQSLQYDVTPMNNNSMSDIFECTSITAQSSRPPSVHDTVVGAFDILNNEQGYASSIYSSSVVDPLSPACQYGTTVMPTLQEESLAMLGNDMAGFSAGLLNGMDDDEDRLCAPQPYSPRQAALIALGDINASIEETGISTDQVNQFMSEQDDGDAKWTCLFPGCGKKFGRKENIRAHIQTHLGDRQFRCNDCGKCFVRQHDLKRHAKIHSGVKPNVCPCGMSFARHDALTRHRQRGTCHGVLPGYEKTDDSKKKRGRPRKERPDLESRIDKASRSRRMDMMRESRMSPHSAMAGAERLSGEELAAIMSAAINQSSHYDGSSESGASDHDSPFTPAPSSEMDEFLFKDFVADDSQTDRAPFSMRPEGAWLVDTPPTSPASYQTLPKTVTPAMLSDHYSVDGSSPASMDDVELALMAWRGEEHPEVVF